MQYPAGLALFIGGQRLRSQISSFGQNCIFVFTLSHNVTTKPSPISFLYYYKDKCVGVLSGDALLAPHADYGETALGKWMECTQTWIAAAASTIPASEVSSSATSGD